MLQMFRFVVLFLAVTLLEIPALHAATFLPITTARHLERSAAVFRGEVIALHSFRNTNDNHICTAASVRVDEIFKGKLPAVLKIVYVGGALDGIGESSSLSPVLTVGESAVFFVSRHNDGFCFATRGVGSVFALSFRGVPAPDSAAGENTLAELRATSNGGAVSGDDLTDQSASPEDASPTPQLASSSSATNLLLDGNNLPARFIQPDRGEPIPYLIDADHLPAGLTTNQAVAAVQAALQAWVNVTSVRYTYLGIQSFGMAASSIQNGDGILRIQLHDFYDSINGVAGGDTLGYGGHVFYTTTLTNGWTTGGNVNGNDFEESINGYIEIAYTNVSLADPVYLAAVLCHEVGHTIGLAHSSNDPNETNAVLKQAIMYYLAHNDGRGATLGVYDPPVARQVHPTNSIPPYMYNRFMHIVTAPATLTNSGANMIQMRGYSLQTNALTYATNVEAAPNVGSFSLSGTTLKFLPKGYYSDNSVDPGSGEAFDRLYARCSDGTNASPFVTVAVVSIGSDSSSEGLPDSWRSNYFGNVSPSVGLKHHVNDDADGDGYSNLEEYILGSDPTSKTSNLRITAIATTNLQWQAKPYELYEIYGTTNFTTWTRAINPIMPTNTVGTATVFTNGGPKEFFRVEKIP
jgi:hypothetical protein